MRMKKAIAIMSAAGLLLSAVPVMPVQTLTASAANGMNGGHITPDATWSLTIPSGVLTISGSGEIPDYTIDPPPWYDYYGLCKEIIIEEGITSIGVQAFSGLFNVESVEIPDSVTTIKYGAFSGDSALEHITIPKNVQEIQARALGYCPALKEVIIFSRTCSINSDAFLLTNLRDLRKGGIFVYNNCQTKTTLRQAVDSRVIYNIPDLNQDGKINMADAQLQQQIALDEMMGINNPKKNRATDFNRDNHITSLEAQFILNYYMNNTLLEDDYLMFYDIVPEGYLGK